jgi:preprotein translocase subunit SecB
MDPKKQPGLQFAQIFLREAHFAHREDALALPPGTPLGELPITIQVQVMGQQGEASAAVAVRVATPQQPDLLYSFSIEIAALITAIQGEENIDPFEYVRTIGPTALFPFVREAVASITMRGRFGPVYLKPFNFTAATLEPVASTAPSQ